MAGQNQFFPFATAPGANVLTPPTWSATTGRQTGAVTGLANPAEANTAWRQGTVIAAMIGDFIAQRGYDALDNADLTTLRANFESALGAQFSASLVHYVVDEGTTANTLVLADITPDVPLIANGMAFVIVPATTNTGAVNAVVTQQGGTVNVPVITRGGTALGAGDIVVGRPFIAIFYAGSLRVQPLVLSELAGLVSSTTIYNTLASTIGTSFFYSNLGAVPDVVQDTGPSADTNTIIGEVNIPAGFINAFATVTVSVGQAAPTSADAAYQVNIWSSEDGGVWQRLEWSDLTKPAGIQTVQLNRSAFRSLDRTKPYRFRSTIWKTASTGAATPPQSSLQVQALKI